MSGLLKHFPNSMNVNLHEFMNRPIVLIKHKNEKDRQ